MTAPRLVAVALIFVLAAAAWFVLGGSLFVRTDNTGSSLLGEVAGLWGQPQQQAAPAFTLAGTRTVKPDLVGSDITADFKLDQRRKGLLWYSTYVVDFAAAYRVTNPSATHRTVVMSVPFPDPTGIYDGFAVRVGGRELPIRYADGSAEVSFDVPQGKTVEVSTGYRTNGLDSWAYVPRPGGAGLVKDFTLVMTTDFGGWDLPDDGVSPTKKDATAGGERLTWSYDSVVSGRNIGIEMPKPLNPGPLAGSITLFAPVSLLFFFAGLILLTATSGIRLHPMHYGFLAAAFFAFHLLFAYLVDRIDINVAFAIASVTSVALVVGYLLVVVGRNRALAEIAVSQLVFLVLFSYSFFFEGLTGLAVTIGSVITLAYFMAKTAHVDWEQVFKREPRQRGWIGAAAHDEPDIEPAPAAGGTPPSPTAPAGD